MGLTRVARIERYVQAVQADIVSCANEQPFDEGEPVWIDGYHTDVADLLISHDVPGELQEEVASKLTCPGCNSQLEIWQDVGTRFDFEVAHDSTIEKALRKYGKQLFSFDRFLQQSPLLGATHPFGKRILKEIQKARRTAIPKQDWFRAKADKAQGFGLAPREFVPDQRYNSSGQACWYLSNSANTAIAELRARSAWVQRFEIGPLDAILDLRSWRADEDRAFDDEGNYTPPHDLLVISLIYCELLSQTLDDCQHPTATGTSAKRQWKPEYLLTRFVADAASVAGFSGILYASVRSFGDNLVVFDQACRPQTLGHPEFIEVELPEYYSHSPPR